MDNKKSSKILHTCKKHGNTQGYRVGTCYSRCRLCADEAQARYRKKHAKLIATVEKALQNPPANDPSIIPEPPPKRFRKPVTVHGWEDGALEKLFPETYSSWGHHR